MKEAKRIPPCIDCQGATKPGSSPACTFEKQVFRLVDRLKDGDVSPADAKARLATLTQGARRRNCPDIVAVRSELGQYINPNLARINPFNPGNVGISSTGLPPYDFTTRARPRSRPPTR